MKKGHFFEALPYVFMYFVLCNLYFVLCTLYFALCTVYFFYFSIFSSFCISCSAVEFVIGMARRNQVLFEPFIRSQKVCMVTITDEPTKLHQMLFLKMVSFFSLLEAKKGRYLIQPILTVKVVFQKHIFAPLSVIGKNVFDLPQSCEMSNLCVCVCVCVCF